MSEEITAAYRDLIRDLMDKVRDQNREIERLKKMNVRLDCLMRMYRQLAHSTYGKGGANS